MGNFTIQVDSSNWPLRAAFIISRGAKTSVQGLMVSLDDGDYKAVAEATPYPHYGETLKGTLAAAQKFAATYQGDEAGFAAALSDLPAGAMRNGFALAYLDLLRERQGTTLWQYLRLAPPKALPSFVTLSLDSPDMMAKNARDWAGKGWKRLKLKLAGDKDDIARVKAVHDAVTDGLLIGDANEGFSPTSFFDIAPKLAKQGLRLLEQPLPADADGALEGWDQNILALCADESFHSADDFAAIKGKYKCVNIKLDKTGGLLQALALKDQAIAQGYQIMVGCMAASSLAIKPALLLGQNVDYVDLDGGLLLAQDYNPPLHYESGFVSD